MFVDKVKKTVRKYKLINRNDRIIIGVSGGPDSVALLYVLNLLKKEFNLCLHVAHLDHGLRKESAVDAKFVEDLCRKLNVGFSLLKANLKRHLKSGSIEEIARDHRLDFFAQLAKKIKTRKIALAHNLDDQAETILMRLLRGAGLYGLSGILPKRIINGLEIIRPLIEIKRKEIEGFLRDKKISFRLDSSNYEDIYFRNKIRNKLLPLLEKEYSLNIKEILSNTAHTIALDYDYLKTQAGKFASKHKKMFKVSSFTKLHLAIQRLVIRSCISNLQGNTRRITFKHILEIEDMIYNRPVHSIVNLPKGVCVQKTKKGIWFYLD